MTNAPRHTTDETGHQAFDTIRRVGQYEIVDLVARGGMAVVYRARQATLSRIAALKKLDLRSDDATLLQRFIDEARVAARLEHPNVVTVFDFLEEDGVPYIAMEYLPRGSLRPWLGRLTEPQIFGALEGILAGLAHAQEQRLSHRDLKPENVLLTARGGVKIADFGIAKAYDSVATRLTAPETAMGTPSYMSPEQAQDLAIGPRTDLYALGVMAFELFSGRTPFSDEGGPMAVLYRHVHEAPPALAELSPSVDRRICAWVGRLLEKDPARRPADAVTAWQALEEIVVDIHGSYWRRRAPIATGGPPADSLPEDISPLSVERDVSGPPVEPAAYVTRYRGEPGSDENGDGKIAIPAVTAATQAPLRPPDAPSAQPSSARGRLLIAGPDATLEVRDDGAGAALRHVTRWQRPRRRRRRTRLHAAPARFSNHVDRDTEIGKVCRSLGARGAINIYGERAIGKTHVLVEALHASLGVAREGVIYLDGRGQSADDLLHALFEELFACPTAIRDPRIGRHLRKRSAVVAIEDISLKGRELRRLMEEAPRCRFVFTSRERVLWDGTAMRVGGIAAVHAPELAEQELGRQLVPDERAAASEIASALAGHPLRLRQAFSDARDRDASLTSLRAELAQPPAFQDRISLLSPAELRVARALAVYDGASVGVEHLRSILDEQELAPALDRLQRRHDVAATADRYRLVGVLAHALPLSDDLVDEMGSAIDHFTAWLEHEADDSDAVLADMPAILALVECAFLDGRSAEAIRLGRAAEPWLSRRQRWAAWGTVLAIILACARDLHDGVTEGWTLNQLGTRSLGLGRTAEAQRLYEKAAETRERAGDVTGAAVARQNLALLQRVPPPLPRASHSSGSLYSIAVIVAVGIGAAAMHLGGDGHTAQIGAAPVSLAVKIVGSGGGLVHSDTGRAPCKPPGCTLERVGGGTITLTAQAREGARFAGWSGGECTGTGACRVRLEHDTTVVARFAKVPGRHAIAIGVDGRGTVFAGGRSCHSRCLFRLDRRKELTLTTVADAGWRFAGWRGDCTGDRPCRFSGSEDPRAVTARFIPVPTPPDDVAIHIAPTGRGVVTSDTHSCDRACVIHFPRGARVELTATPASDGAFEHWIGPAGCGTTDTCRFTADADTTVGARFGARKALLTVAAAGDGRGSVTVDGRGRTCERGCLVPIGRPVTMRVHHDPDATTLLWSDARCTRRSCTIRPDGDTSVTARFDPRVFTLRASARGPGTIDLCAGARPCSEPFEYGRKVKLTAVPGDGEFAGWTGCKPKRPRTCVVTMTTDHVVRALFLPPLVTLHFERAGDAGGTPTANGKPCPEDVCTVRKGQIVTLSGNYDPNSTTLAFAGAPCAVDGCRLTVVADTKVKAIFSLKRYSVVVTATGPGAVEVCPSATPDANCSTGGTHMYPHGTKLRLTALPGDGASLAELEGCEPSRAGVCEFDVTENRTITARFGRSVELIVRRTGDAPGSVLANGQPCDEDKHCYFAVNTTVSLVAKYRPASTVLTWTPAGSCTGSPCDLVLDGHKDITADFSLKPVRLTVKSTGLGDVDACDPAPGCVLTRPYGTRVRLTARDGGDVFDKWAGCDTMKDRTCEITLRKDRTAAALFVPAAELTVETDGLADGTVVVHEATESGGVECSKPCRFKRGATVTLEPRYDEASTIVTWSLKRCRDTCTIKLDDERTSVTAQFDIRRFNVEVGAREGTVGVYCARDSTKSCDYRTFFCETATCSLTFDYGTMLDLDAIPHPGWDFTGWVGCTSQNSHCSFRVTRDWQVTATFAPPKPTGDSRQQRKNTAQFAPPSTEGLGLKGVQR